jgi:ArsR family metal-binding transcriptional regulator
MEKECQVSSILDNCRITLVAPTVETENYITRVIIELNGDITPFLQHLSRVIENCGYRRDVKTIAFRLWDMPVVVHSNIITINNMRDLETVHQFLDWLKNKLAETG